MTRRVPTACKWCGHVEPQRNYLTKRGYHVDCAGEAQAANARQVNAREGELYRRRLVNTIIRAQLELMAESRRVVARARETA